MPVGWIDDPFLLKHDTGPDHLETPERLNAIREAFDDSGILSRLVHLPAERALPEVIEQVHEPAYVALVRMACEEGMTFLGSRDTVICPASYDAARTAVGGVLAAVEAVMAGMVRSAFCAVRPPGHHAERDQAMGFCLFNNVAVAAENLIHKHGLARVAIVDWDVHHGNGTQHIFEQRPDVFYFSIHESPGYLYPHSGYATETGLGTGRGFTLNIPMAPGSDDSDYRRAFAEQLIPSLDAYRPEFVLVSAGFDAVHEERLADIDLQPESFRWMTRELCAVANRHCAGRLVSVLEGGYHLPSLARSAMVHVQALLEADSAWCSAPF